jgi:hypothetical protein
MKSLSHLAGHALATLMVVGCLSCPTFGQQNGQDGENEDGPPVVKAPELDPGSMGSALTLLSGGVLLLSSRRKVTS